MAKTVQSKCIEYGLCSWYKGIMLSFSSECAHVQEELIQSV